MSPRAGTLGGASACKPVREDPLEQGRARRAGPPFLIQPLACLALTHVRAADAMRPTV